MADVNPQDVAELLSAPLEELIVALGSGIGRSQAELDRHSIETQRRIDEDPVLSQFGLQATWYQMPSTEMELRVAFAMERQTTEETTGGPLPAPGIPPRGIVAGRAVPPVPRLWAQPVNARYVNLFAFDVQAASTVRLTVVPVPPPGTATATPARMTEAEVLAAARKFLQADAAGEPAGRVTINFNPGARAWFVVQTQEQADQVDTLAVVKIDDDTGAILKPVQE
jgi:hypothetical protein